MLQRWSAKIFALSLVFAAYASAAQAQRFHRFVIDAGVGQINWLSPQSWGLTVAAQSRLVTRDRFALTAGLRGTFDLATPGTGVTRRDNVATGLLGIEFAALNRKNSAVFVSASGAFSRYTARYSGPSARLVASGPISGFTWPSAILGLRAELLRDRRVGLAIRSDVRPRGGKASSLNPTFGIGLTL